jgi:hypothetical protein
LIGDKAYDSDGFDEALAELSVEMTALCREMRNKTQDGRPLRSNKWRYKVERIFAWLQNFRRLLARFDCYRENYLGFVYFACIKILITSHFEGLLVNPRGFSSNFCGCQPIFKATRVPLSSTELY